MHFGSVIHARGDVVGDAVNLTARLAALARPGEVLAAGCDIVIARPWVSRKHVTVKVHLVPTGSESTPEID